MDAFIPNRFIQYQDKIDLLKKQSRRFKRIYSEYQTLSKELSVLEGGGSCSVTDDFLYAVRLQIYYLEEEIVGWLFEEVE